MKPNFRQLLACSICFCAALAVPPSLARAEELQTLTVSVFTITLAATDRTPVGMNELIHLVIDVHVREHIDRLNNLILPDLAGFQTEGDEHTLTSEVDGTYYRETLTLTPKQIGHYTLGPATLDAVNRRTGKPSQFSSNTIPLTVQAAGRQNGFAAVIRAALLLVLVLIAVAFTFFGLRAGIPWVMAKLAARRRPVVIPAPIVAPAPAPIAQPVAGRLARLDQALSDARRAPSHAVALELRLALRDSLRAGPDETLSDILIRVPDGERGIFARALRAAERAAFIDEDARLTAIEEALTVIEAARARLEREV